MRGLAVLAVDDELGDHRVVVGRDAVPGTTCVSIRTPGPPAGASVSITPALGMKFFSGSSALMRHSIAWPVDLDVLLLEGQGLAGGDADGGLDDVHAGDHLGDRVLDLHAGVDLEHVEVLSARP
jgi:hypothetical protein